MKLVEHLIVDLVDNDIDADRARDVALQLYAKVNGGGTVQQQSDTYNNIGKMLASVTEEIEDLTKMRNALTVIRDRWAITTSTTGHTPKEITQ